MDKLKRVLNGKDEDEEEGIVTQISDATTLSWGTRIKGFIACFVIGILCSLLGSFLLWLPPNGLILFAIFYSIGSITALMSTCFLMGPIKQCKRMFEPTRLIASILVLVFIALTLMSALWWGIAGLALLFCILQFLAMAWYSISYIPFARDAIKKCFTSCVSD